MTKRFIFTWKDETEEARFKAMAEFEGVSMSEMMHRVIAQIPVIGSIPSSGTAMYDRLDKMHADKKPHISLVHDINDIEIVGSDGGWE